MSKNKGKSLLYTTIIGAALTLLCTTTSTSARNMPEKEATELWAGPYWGVYFGGGAGNTSASLNGSNANTIIITNTATPPPATNARLYQLNLAYSGYLTGKTKGASSDLFVGYNFHKRNSLYLLGAQLEGAFFSKFDQKSSGSIPSSTSVSTTSVNNSTTTLQFPGDILVRSESALVTMISLIGRAGILIKPNILMYGLLGATEGDFYQPYTTETTGSRSSWNIGLNAGTGFEYKFNRNWSFMAEYRYMHFSFNSSGASDNNGANYSNTYYGITNNTNVSDTHTNMGLNMGKIGIVFRY